MDLFPGGMVGPPTEGFEAGGKDLMNDDQNNHHEEPPSARAASAGIRLSGQTASPVLAGIATWWALAAVVVCTHASAQESPPSGAIASYEAEGAAAFSGVEVARRYPGFSGSGYIASFDQAGDFVRFDISVPRQDYYTLSFRFLNGEGQPAIRKLLLDGREVPGLLRFRNGYDFARFGEGGAWSSLDESVRLSAGQHSVALVYRDRDGQGSVLIDRLEVLDETSPSFTSTRGLIMNNWMDLVAIHQSAKAYETADTASAPRLTALHWKGDWPTNQIDGAGAYFRDATSGEAYTEAERFDSNLYLDADGIVYVDYLNYGDEALPVSIDKAYAMVPDEPVLLARYRVTNTSGQGRSFDLMELADLAGLDGDNASDGTAGGASSGGALAGNMRAFWDGASRAWIVYLGREKPAFLVFGTFDFRGQRAATSATGDGPLGKGSPLLTTFASGDALTGNSEASGNDLLLALSDTLTLDPGRTREITFFYSVQGQGNRISLPEYSRNLMMTLATASPATRRATWPSSCDPSRRYCACCAD